MKTIRVGILGATGAVGETLREILEQRLFPVSQLRLFASQKSKGKTRLFHGQKITIEAAEEADFHSLDVIFGALKSEWIVPLAKKAIEAGAVLIDNSSAFRMDPKVPLVIPEINPEDLDHHCGIVANPNCATILALMAAAPIHALSPIQRMIVASYQAVSGAGQKGIGELTEQLQAFCQNQPLHHETFCQPIVCNVIPEIGPVQPNGYTQEEMKLLLEGRKILHHPSLQVSCTCVRVPVLRCHCEALVLETAQPLTIEQIKKALRQAPGIFFEEGYQTPAQWSNQDRVAVGRVRPDLSFANGVSLWCVMDQLRKGAATNAVQIAETMLQRNLL